MNTVAATIAPQEISPPSYIAIEGPIGVGKTTLTKRLAETFNYDILLELAEDNPFLPKFYQNQRQAAFQTQLFFLMQRAQQIQSIRQNDLFQPVRVADFLIDKDRLFAELTLDDDELKLYDQVYQHLTIDAPVPDLVIYLQAPSKVLLERIEKRGVQFEQRMDKHYLERLNEAYLNFFHYYDAAPLLIVNAEVIDLVNNEADYRQLVDYILNIKSGRHYFNPAPAQAI